MIHCPISGPPTIAAAALLACAALAAPSAAGNWACTFSPESRFSQTTRIQMPLAGTWIGNYDAAANPAGTQTRPGLFGGTGNVAIPFSSVVKPTAQITDSVPVGGYALALDTSTGAVEVSAFAADMLGGQVGTIATSIALTYSTFRSFSPNSTYIGVSNVDVPLQSGTLDVATAAQAGPSTGVATPNADGTWSFALSVPVDVTVAGTAIGQPFSSTSPGALALSGTIAFEGDSVRVTSQASGNQVAPVPPGPPLVDAPFDMPTILPPGQVAHLLMSGTFSEGTSDTTSSASLVATGTPAARPGDLDGDGSVTGSDLGILLASWGGAGPGDLNGDGTVTGADLGVLLANWG